MPFNVFDMTALRDMNKEMVKRLDDIIARLDTLIELQTKADTVKHYYGDGK